MTDDLSLFGDDEPPAAPPARSDPAPVADWQVDLLRKALDARELATMEERRHAIESAVGRSVESLRGLTQEEALAVLNRLGQTSGKKTSTSLWDDREEDTWIDRL